MLNYVVLDDDTVFLNGFKNELLCIDKNANVYCFSDNGELIKHLKKHGNETDAAFIDIRINESNGIDIAKEIFKIHPNIKLIFVTGFGKEYFEEIFIKVKPFALLQKPVKTEYLKKHVNDLQNFRNLCSKNLCIKQNKANISLPFDDIFYLESEKRKVHIHTVNGIYDVYEKLDELTERLDNGFVRCQKSYCVNLSYVTELQQTYVVLNNDMKINVSSSNRTEVKKRFFEFKYNKSRGSL